MTLLLGPPSSRKTTLLMALARKLDPQLNVSGRVTYNGHDMTEYVPQRTSAYISQHDLHIGELTVRETLDFSARCQGVGPRYELLAELSRREKQANIAMPDPDLDVFMKAASIGGGQEASVMTDYIIKILGLEICADTLVGDEMFRGISGGQRNRLTAGEMMVGPARALFMDEISTGLDSSTTFEIVNSIRESIHILQGTTIISLLQPAPETYELFDDIILLSDGQIVYQGPRECVLEFFEFMGFSVTSKKDQEQYWMKSDEPYNYISAKEFSEAFQSFHVGRKLCDELSVPFPKETSHPAALMTNKYGLNKKEILKACVAREFLLMKRNSFVYIFKMIKVIIMAIISMTVFLRTEMHKKTVIDGGIYMGALFYALNAAMFNGFSELALSILKLPVFFKQRDLLFFPSWAYSIPAWILKIPITLLGASFWVGITYYTTGYDSDAERIFKQWLLLICINQMANGLFRLMGALGRNIIVANTFGSCALLMVLALGGFILSRDNIQKWWIWGYWLSPLMYGQNAVAVNEFLGKSWSYVPPGSTEPVGVTVLRSRGIFPEARWYWIGVGAVVGYVVLFNFLVTLALTYLSPLGKPQAILPEETSKERVGRTRGESVGLSSVGRDDGAHTSASSSNAIPNRKRGMILPFETHSITFDDIRYAVDMPQEMKAQGIEEDRLELLKGISGAFRPGVLTALMGISGAGKTTLMDVLAGRKTGGYIDGSITISGYPKKQETFARIAGYCEQTDIHSPHVTVYESLQFSAWLRLPPEVDAATRKSIQRDGFDVRCCSFSRRTKCTIGSTNCFDRANSILQRESSRDVLDSAVVELPHLFIQTLVYGVIVYAMIGLDWTVAKFFWYIFFMYFTLLYFTFYGMMTAAVTPNHNIANVVSSAFYAIWNLFSGFIIPKTRIPVWWRWYYYLCPVAWTLYGLVASQFGDVEAELDTNEMVKDFIHGYFDYKHDMVGYVAVIIVGIAVLFGFIFAFSIRAFNFQTR
ncbi:hypothetical protein CASFOL_027168 [Castilleja foliolosa]|uniref:ABC transporter domain-containing protein n=1 Tax=Castilleja foliolosa TaxID=1961234 RepID=A0ABD3CEY0_9LAMI